MVRQLWSKPDGSWTGSRPALYVEKFDELVVSQSAPSSAENGDDPSPQPMSEVDEKALWIAAYGGPKNHRIFAMGEEGAALIRNGKATDQHTKPQATSTTQTFQDAQIREEVREEIKQMQSTMMEFMQKQQQQQDFMKQLQTNLFQQFSLLQGGQNLTSTVNRSNSNPGLNTNP